MAVNPTAFDRFVWAVADVIDGWVDYTLETFWLIGRWMLDPLNAWHRR